jgi:hypothetical protein
MRMRGQVSAALATPQLAHLRNMPLARCVKATMRLSAASIDPAAPTVSSPCKQVRLPTLT